MQENGIKSSLLSLTTVFAIFINSTNWSRRMYLPAGQLYRCVAISEWSLCLVSYAERIESVPNIRWRAGCSDFECRFVSDAIRSCLPTVWTEEGNKSNFWDVAFFFEYEWQERSRNLAVQGVLYCGHSARRVTLWAQSLRVTYITRVTKSKWRWSVYWYDAWKKQWSSGETWSAPMSKRW
jgi:hypothetical protein